MALNKLKIGTALSTQITEQNANIEQIDNFMSGGIYPLTLESSFENVTNNDLKAIVYAGGIVQIVGDVMVKTTLTVNTLLISTIQNKSILPKTGVRYNTLNPDGSKDATIAINADGTISSWNIKNAGHIFRINIYYKI